MPGGMCAGGHVYLWGMHTQGMACMPLGCMPGCVCPGGVHSMHTPYEENYRYLFAGGKKTSKSSIVEVFVNKIVR